MEINAKNCSSAAEIQQQIHEARSTLLLARTTGTVEVHILNKKLSCRGDTARGSVMRNQD